MFLPLQVMGVLRFRLNIQRNKILLITCMYDKFVIHVSWKKRFTHMGKPEKLF